MKTTELIIRVTIKHDTDKVKHQAINALCDGLQEGYESHGQNGNGEQFELKVTKIIENKIK